MTTLEDNNKRPIRSSVMRYVSFGTELLVILGLAVWGGLWLDERLKLSPLFLIALPLIGLVVVFTRLIRSLNRK